MRLGRGKIGGRRFTETSLRELGIGYGARLGVNWVYASTIW